MNSEQFVSEIRNSSICPDNFEYIYSEFSKYQQLTLEVLKAFHAVCEKQGIRYQLAFGSLLGAVRDDGQIPWDYDMDVFIPYEDREKLVIALQNELPGKFYFYCPETNRECRHYFMRISPVGYRSDKLHIDVFYLIGTPSEEDKRIPFENDVMKYFELRYIKLVKLKDYDRIKKKIQLARRKIQSFRFDIDEINNKLEQLCNEYDSYSTGLTTPVFTVYKHLAWDTNMLWDTELIDTSKGTFRISRNYDYILKKIYGDYLKIYPLENRLAEMINCYIDITGDKSIKHIPNGGRYYIPNKEKNSGE